MRRTLLLFLNVMLACLTTFFASCSKDGDVAEPENKVEEPTTSQLPTYTVMLYGCPATVNIDNDMDCGIRQVESYGKHSRVNFTAMVKYPASYQSEESMAGTRLYTLTDQGMKNEKKYDATYRMDNPEHLANFIKETKEKLPADKYVLVIFPNSLEFGFGDKLVESSYPEGESQSRAFASDDNTGNALSIYELEKGIKDSGVKLDLLFFDVPLNGMIETYYQLKDCTKYVMGTSTAYAPSRSNYLRLMADLQENDSLQDAIKSYVPAVVNEWVLEDETSVVDLECFDTQYMDELAQNMKTATSALINLRKEQADVPDGLDDFDERQKRKTTWYGLTSSDEFGGLMYIFKSSHNVSVDLYSALTRVANNYRDGKLTSAASLVGNTIDRMTVARASYGLPNWLGRVSVGINWPTMQFLTLLWEDGGYQEERLRNSAFYQATGWDKFLMDEKYSGMDIAVFPSAYYSDTYFFYGGVWSSYYYMWDVAARVDESKVDEKNLDQVRQMIAELNHNYQSAFASKFGSRLTVRYSRALAEDMYNVAYYKYRSQLLSLGVEKLIIHVQLGEGESLDPNDEDATKYPTSADMEYDLRKVKK